MAAAPPLANEPEERAMPFTMPGVEHASSLQRRPIWAACPGRRQPAWASCSTGNRKLRRSRRTGLGTAKGRS